MRFFYSSEWAHNSLFQGTSTFYRAIDLQA
jgi:hypothetical protein